MSRFLLFTVYYPGAEAFEKDFFSSILGQTKKNFSILVVNDTDNDLHLSVKYPSLSIFEIRGCSNIAGNRALGINYAIDNDYGYIMLCDIDDLLSSYRVEEIINIAKDYDIIVNDLDIVDSKNNKLVDSYFSKRINNATILDGNFIKDKNIFGFSNTTIRISKIEKVQFPRDLKIVDWYYFTQLLHQGLSAVFLPKALTYYRQHSDNMVGLSSYTLGVFKSQLKLKKKHYLYFSGSICGYDELYNNMDKLEVLSDSELSNRIIENEIQTPYPLWWENIR